MYIFRRPGVDRAALQTTLSFSDSFIYRYVLLFLPWLYDNTKSKKIVLMHPFIRYTFLHRLRIF